MSDGAELHPGQPESAIRVLLLGQELLTVAALKALLAGEPDFTVASTIDDRPDLAIVDDAGSDPTPLRREAQRLSRRRLPFLVLQRSSDSRQMAEILRLGARGVVFRHQEPETLTRAARAVHRGELWLDRGTSSRLITDLLGAEDATHADPGSPPTQRDRRIVRLVSEGLTNSEIAQGLGVSEGTIRNRLTVLFRWAGVRGRLQLVGRAREVGLLREGAEVSMARPAAASSAPSRV